MRRSIARSALLAAAALTLGIPTATSPASAASQTSLLPGIPDSAVLTGSALVVGVAQRADGTAEPGARAVLYAWPTNDVLDAAAVGDSVKLQPVAQVIADSNGRYGLRLPNAHALDAWTDAHGVANLEVMVAGASGDGVVAFSHNNSSSASTNVDVRVSGAQHITGSVSDIAKATCATTVAADLGVPLTIVGQTYSNTIQVVHSFTYKATADSSLGVGISATGAYGSFSLSGTSSVSSSSTVSFPAQGDFTGTYYKTQFHYKKFKTSCPATGHVDYQARPTGFAGGAQTSPATIPAHTYCVFQQTGSSFTKHDSTAITWTNGVNLTSAIGISLSAVTGYTVDAEVTFVFKYQHNLCGTSDYPGGTPYRLVAEG